MEVIPNLKRLFNDHYTYDVVLRIDGKCYFAHSIILKYQSGYFLEYFKEGHDDKRKNGKYYIDCSCLMKSCIVVKNWYDIFNKEDCKDENDRFHNVEFYYDYEIFGKFLSYFYGCPIYMRTNEQLFTIAYLAKKFKVTGLTKMMDGLLKYLPTAWQQNDIDYWKFTLNICKWLELDQTQLGIMNYLKMREENKVGLNNEKKRRRDEEESESSLTSLSSGSSSENSSSDEDSDSLAEN
ncbi:17703_t:CDS:2 [Funneliformis caledonium]|uniref:17703_t:CDS:1 n=1 Tax=Funneliformis caledonium TaxID=1117310 RepID=A0A9N8VG84_9GLOM|nr:17703_t:CDS:2 [Funneliformis caledonium]